jgi:hypothetical protein
LCEARVLVDPEEVAGRVEKRREDFGPVLACREDDRATFCNDGLRGGGGVGDHDVGKDAGVGIGCPVADPCATDLSGRVVERGPVRVARSDVPAEGALVKGGGLVDIEGRDLEVADLAVGVDGD